jgi:hypothetical protein
MGGGKEISLDEGNSTGNVRIQIYNSDFVRMRKREKPRATPDGYL